MGRSAAKLLSLTMCLVAVAACTSRTTALPDGSATQEADGASATSPAIRTPFPTTTPAATPSPITEPSPVPDPPTGRLISGYVNEGLLELEPIFTFHGELPAQTDQGE